MTDSVGQPADTKNAFAGNVSSQDTVALGGGAGERAKGKLERERERFYKRLADQGSGVNTLQLVFHALLACKQSCPGRHPAARKEILLP